MPVSGILSISDVAKRVRVTPDAIRLAERQGRIAQPRRDQLGHRIYDQRDVERIQRVLSRG